MKKQHLFLFLLLLNCIYFNGQITLIGHCNVNGTPLNNVIVSLQESGKVLQTLETKNKNTFSLRLNFGKNYKLYVQQANCAVMFIEINALNVPENKRYINMVNEFDIPFFYKDDEDIDTTVFSKPIQKIQFDGDSKMISDTSYVNAFYKTIIKPKKAESLTVSENHQVPTTIAAQIILDNNPLLIVKNQPVSIYNLSGEIIKTTSTDRFGNFIVTAVIPSQIQKIRLTSNNANINQLAEINLVNAVQKLSLSTQLKNQHADWVLSNSDKNKLINPNFTNNIGGKLIHVSKGKKSFLANKTVYLSNKRNTVIKKTKTNALGAFVFDEIKPDQNYLIGIENTELEKGEKIDLINKDDDYIASVDSLAGKRYSVIFNASNNTLFNALSISESEMRMNVNAKLFGDNNENPLGKIKIILLNDAYEVIDSTVTDDLGLFKFKYLPYLKRFFLSAENNNNQLDIFKNIIMYNSEENLIKVLTHIKGTKFVYKPISSEIKKMQELELEDPWFEIGLKKAPIKENKIIIEPILFNVNDFKLLPAAIETLNKITAVLQSNLNIKIEIGAHTDSKGNDNSNLILSEKRAKAVYDYLVKNGISKTRLTAKGYGEKHTINRCKNDVDCSELEHALNRRVEFKIISK